MEPGPYRVKLFGFALDVLFNDLLNLVKTKSSSLVVLDVRKKEELAETGAIPGSKCVPRE